MPFFYFFSFFEHNGKNEKMVRINIIFFIFPFFYFWGKVEKRKNELGIEDYFIFLTFQTISKIKNSFVSCFKYSYNEALMERGGKTAGLRIVFQMMTISSSGFRATNVRT